MTAPESVVARLLRNRIVLIGGEITDKGTEAVIAQILYLDSTDAAAEITLYINSPGGLATASMAILDAMESVRPPVSTMAIGQAEGTAALLLAAGRRGGRVAWPEARVALLPLSTTSSQPNKETQAWMARLRVEMVDRLARYTGQPAAVVSAAMERRVVLSAWEAKLYGLVDEVREPRRD